MAARSVVFCRAAVVLFDGGVPEVSVIDRLSCPCSWFLGASEQGFPSPEIELRRIRLCLNMKTVVYWSKTKTKALQDGGFLKFEVRRLPVRMGALLFQVKRSSGGGAPAACSAVAVVFSRKKDVSMGLKKWRDNTAEFIVSATPRRRCRKMAGQARKVASMHSSVGPALSLTAKLLQGFR